MPLTELRQVDYSHADAQRLIAEVQQEYVRRYGGPDDTPVENGHFSPPNGIFVVLYEDGVPVATGGWRLQSASAADTESDGPDAELKRMYVVPGSRGRGHARRVLAHLERSAAAAGARRLVLETGTMQPEAIALYRAAGYTPVPAFGHYADEPGSVHLGKPLELLPGPDTPSLRDSAGISQ